MEFKKIVFDADKFYTLQNDDEKIDFLTAFTVAISKTKEIDYSTFLIEEIDNHYFEIINFIKNEKYQAIKSADDIKNLLKIIKAYPQFENQIDFSYTSLYKILELGWETMDGFKFNKKKIGYKVFLEFKRRIIAETAKQSQKKIRSADVNYKFAILQEMGVIKWLENNIPTNNDDRAEILQEIMGGSTETIKDYLKGKTIHKDVRQKALDLINAKRYPK